jgi:putative dehydrogenase
MSGNGGPIGVVGLGAMGLSIAKVLLRRHFQVFGCDVRAGAREQLRHAGGIAFEQPDAVGERCPVLIVFVVDSAQTEEVLFGHHGAALRMRAGNLVIVCTTTGANFMSQLGARLESQGILMLDAPVTGGVVGAVEGKLTILASGPDQAFAAGQAVLQAFSTHVHRFGPLHGQGTKAKIVNQLLVGVHIAVAAEAMAFAKHEGLDLDLLYEAIRQGAGNSWAFADRVPRMIEGSFARQTALDIFVKDLAVVLATAQSGAFHTPLALAAYQMFASASASGMGSMDDSAVISVFPMPAGRDGQAH